MNIRFTIEEENIIAIYAEDSRETTLENILAAMPYMDEDLQRQIPDRECLKFGISCMNPAFVLML